MNPFEQQYKKLNPEQRQAVDKMEGPVLVIAGPGTGKTSILATRIGHILRETDTEAEQILCLTFTDAGVHSMRQKLLELIGVMAHKVNIHTFHSFCGRVMRENTPYFGDLNADPADDILKNSLMVKLFDKLDKTNRLIKGRKDRYYYISACLDLFQNMKRENWSVTLVQKRIELHLEALKLSDDYYYKRNTKTNKKGDFNEAKYNKEADKFLNTLEGVKLFGAYNKALKDNESYDFADMIRWVIDAFEKNEELLLNYQEQFQYILLDEYQDTNGAQNDLVKLLVSYWAEDPNLFIVGDDDQAIYGFQGARLENILDFRKYYKDNIEMVVLKSNYRSSQKILDASTALINENEGRFINHVKDIALDKDIIAKHGMYATLKDKPMAYKFDQHLHEVVYNVQKIENLIAEGVAPEEIAILYRSHKLAEDYIKLFEAKGIPFSTKKPINIRHHVFIQRLLNLLEYIDLEHKMDQQGDYLIFEILHYKNWGISARDISKIALYKARNPRIQEGEEKRYQTFLEILRQPEILAKIELERPEAIPLFLNKIDQILDAYGDKNYYTFVEYLINQGGFIDYALRQSASKFYLDLLTTFLDFVKQETLKDPNLNKEKLFGVMKMMEERKISLPLEKKLGANKGVNLMTTHASKGLEFEYVFIIEATAKNWEKMSGNNRGFKLPPALTRENPSEDLEASRRLFFVAMTRAKKQLFISYPTTDAKGKDILRSQFVDEIDERGTLDVEAGIIDEKRLLEDQIRLITTIDHSDLYQDNQQQLSWLLDKFKLTFSSMSTYLKCPVSFYYDSLLKIPQPQSIHMAYGTAIHNTLDKFVKKYNKDGIVLTFEDVLTRFEQELQKFGFTVSKMEMEQLTLIGHESLQKYIPILGQELDKKIEVETAIEAMIGNTPIKGILDKVIFPQPDKAIISDYKTGKSGKTAKRSARNEMGGMHWQQILFYKLLFEAHHSHKKQMIGGEIIYLEEEKTVPLQYTPEDEAWLSEIIEDTYAKIMNMEFSEGCNEATCKWCNFVKNNPTN